jgi:hypothetical protein
MDNSRENPHSFTAFSSAAQDAAQQRQEAALVAAQTNRGQGGANAAPSEITTLERRVLAHERILQALIVRLAEDDSDILVQLKATFGSGHDLGEYEQDYVSTDHYGDHFICSVERAIATLDRQADD